MKIQILNDLYNEINRLLIAGSKFAKDDPRLQKYVPSLQKIGEKSPVMKKLAEKIELLSSADSNDSMLALTDAGLFLHSVLNTQGSTAAEENFIVCEQELINEQLETKLPYSKLKPIIEALTTTKSGRAEVIKKAYEENTFDDVRLYGYYSFALADRYAEIASFVSDIIIPALNNKMVYYLLKDFDLNGKKADAKRLELLDQLNYENVYELAQKVLSETKSEEVHIEAIKILGKNTDNEKLLLELCKNKKQGIREAALVALIRMDSKEGRDWLIKILDSSQFKSGVEAAKLCTDDECNKKIFDIVENRYTLYKTAQGDAKESKEKRICYSNLSDIFYALENKKYYYVLDFYSILLKDMSFYDFDYSPILYSFMIGEASTLPKEKGIAFFEDLCSAKIKNDSASTYVWNYYLYANQYLTPDEIFLRFSRFYKNDYLKSLNINRTYSTQSYLNALRINDQKVNLSDKWIPLIIEKNDISAMIEIASKYTPDINKILLKYVMGQVSAKKTDYDVTYVTLRLSQIYLENEDKPTIGSKLKSLIGGSDLEALKEAMFKIMVAQKKNYYLTYSDAFRHGFVYKLYKNTDYEKKLKKEADGAGYSFKEAIACFDE